MESVLDSVRSWRDLTAGLLPRVASAAQLEAKRLAVAQSSQASGAMELSRSLRKAAEKLSTRSDALLTMVEELREIAVVVAAEDQAKEKTKAEKTPSRKDKEKAPDKKKHRDKDKEKASRSGRAPPPPPESPGPEAQATAHAERTARVERMSADDGKGKAPPPPPPPPSEESPPPADEFTAVSLEELVEAVRAAARLPASLRARDVVTQGRIILGVSDGGGTMREELVRLRKYGQLQQAPPPPPSESDNLHSQRESDAGSSEASRRSASPTPEPAAATAASSATSVAEPQKESMKSGADSYRSSAADVLQGIKSAYMKVAPQEYSDTSNKDDGSADDSWASSGDEGGEGSSAQPDLPDHDSQRNTLGQRGVAVDTEYVVDDEDDPEAEKDVPEDYYKDLRSTTAARSATDDSGTQEYDLPFQGQDGDAGSNTAHNMDANDDPRFSSLGQEDETEEALDWETQALRRQQRGWVYPGAAGGEWDEGRRLIGRRVFVNGYGEGTVTDFTKKTLGLIGTSAHSIDFNTPGSGNDPGLIMSVKLQRKGRNGALWLVWPGETEAARRVANLERQRQQQAELEEDDESARSGGVSWSSPKFPGSDDDPRFASMHYVDEQPDLAEQLNSSSTRQTDADQSNDHPKDEGEPYGETADEATWVDAAEADRWEQEQARRWTGEAVGSFPDTYGDTEYLPTEPEPEPEPDKETSAVDDESELIFVAKRKPPRRNRGGAAAAAAAAAVAAAQAKLEAERKAAQAEKERCAICGRGGILCRCRGGSSSSDAFSFPTAPLGGDGKPPEGVEAHSPRPHSPHASTSSPASAAAAGARSAEGATGGVERDRSRDRERRRPPERSGKSSRRQQHSGSVPPPPPPPPTEDYLPEANLPSPPASPSPSAVQKQEEMDAKLKARQAERLQAERMATMRATQKEREVRAVEAEIERQVSLWAGRKDLRGLLASLPSIWSAAAVSTFPPSLYSERGEGKVKKAYMQALRLVHPDKLPANTAVRDEVQATKIFTRIQAAYEIFKET